VFGNSIDREKAPFDQAQYGATFGGPIVRDRTFFFLSAEKLGIEASNFVTIDPTAAALLNARGFPVELGNVPYEVESQDYLAKVDHQWTQSHNLTARINYSKLLNENIEPFGGITARSRGASQDRKDWALALSETDVLSSRWVNELRAQYAAEDQLISSLDPTCNGICDDQFEGGPTVEIVGVASVGRQRFTPQPRDNARYQLKDTINFAGTSHFAKMGFDWNYIKTKETALPLHFGGRYIFQALPAIPGLLPAPVSATRAFELGIPAAYVQGYGSSGASYDDYDVALFAQDDWTISDRLTIKAGLRYQRQFMYDTDFTVSAPGGTSYTYQIPEDTNNIAPRVAVVFDPRGDGRSSIHGSYGIFYDNHILANAQIAEGIDGTELRTRVVGIPGSIGAWNAPGRRIAEGSAPYASLVIAADPGLETPYAHQASVGYDRSIGSNMAVSADLLYVRGYNQLGTIDYNPRVPALGHPQRRPNDINGQPGTSASILQYTSFGETEYQGLTLAFNRRLANRFQYLMSYTLSKAEDTSTDFQSNFITMENGRGRDMSDPTGLPIGFDPELDRGPATHDQRHRFVLSGLYQAPFGFNLSTIITAASGRPYTPLAGFDFNQDGDGGAFPSDRARTNPADPSTAVGRNSEVMDNIFNVDARISKRFSFGPSIAFEGIVDVFNLFDRVNYTEINNIFGPGAYPGAGVPSYGLYEQAQPGRQFQLGAKFVF
jgi:hypothetical protein